MTVEPADESSLAAVRCIACGVSIAAGANICPTCRSYQHWWRNEIQFWAGVVGLATLIASGLVFTGDLADKLRKRWFGQEIVVSELNIFGKTIVWESFPESPIHLNNFHIITEAPRHHLTWHVNQTIDRSAFKTVCLGDIAKATWGGIEAQWFGEKPGSITSLDKKLFADLQKNRHYDKYVPSLYLSDSVDLDQFKKFLRGGNRDVPLSVVRRNL